MYLKLCYNKEILFFLISVIVTITVINGFHNQHYISKIYGPYKRRATGNPSTQKICMHIDSTLKARHKSCFLRPDTGPCRADIIQWYYDVKLHRCFRFFWGGCQGNGNRFETKAACNNYCYLNATSVRTQVPFFCSLAFEYGDCFGYFHRWGWDKLTKSCRRYLYSGCGGNQNNFHTNIECLNTCISIPNNTLQQSVQKYTTCVPINIPDLQ